MCKRIFILPLLGLLALFCAIKHDNPLDPESPEYIAPEIFLDTLATSIHNGDTIHVDSARIVYTGNDTINEYRVWIDNDTTTEWTFEAVFSATDLADGRHTLHAQTRYHGGVQIDQDSITFFVLTAGYQPHFAQSADTALTIEIFAPCTLSVNPAVIVPVEYQWHNNTVDIIGGNENRLIFLNIQMTDTGDFFCVATTSFGIDTSRVFTINVTDNRDTAKAITAFFFLPLHNSALFLPIVGQFGGQYINLTVPFGTPRDSLIARFTTTGTRVQVNGVAQKSDSSANDFTDTVTYTVMAENQTEQEYKVIVSLGTLPMNVDGTPPTIALLDTSINGDTISADSKKIEAIIKDSGVVDAVRFSIAGDSFPVTKYNDTIYFATVSGLTPFAKTTITIEAWDTTGNHTSLNMYLRYDPTADDNQPPVFTHIAGPVNGQRVTADTGTITYRIVDQSGVDSVYLSLNGSFVESYAVQPDSTYELAYALVRYGLNRIDIYAIDGSTGRNQGHETIELIYNTRLSGFDVISPPDSAVDLDHLSGVLLRWARATDPDGDSIRYEVFYSESTTVFQTLSTKEDTMRLTDLAGGRAYYFFILAITVFDTSRCPAAESGFRRFFTRYRPADITGFVNQTASINDTLTHNVVADDPDGTREYRWDLYGDGTNLKVTAIGSVTFKAPDAPGTYKSILSFVNAKGTITKDTAILNITDSVPHVTIPDTVTAGIGTVARVQVSASDDGQINIFMSPTLSGTYQQFSGDTSITLADTALPYALKRFIQVRDDDGHTVQDSVIIQKTFLTTTQPLPYSGVMRSFAGMYLLQKGASIIRSTDGVTWDSIAPRVPASVMLPKSTCYSKGTFYLAAYDSIFKAVGDSVWIGTLRLPNNIVSGGQGMGRSGFALSRLRNELIIAGGWSMSGPTTYQVDSAYVTGMEYGINGFYQAIRVVHPVGGYDFPICEDKDTVYCLEGSAVDPQQYLTAVIFDTGPEMGKPAIKYRNALLNMLQENSYTAIFAENGTVYIADKNGIWYTRDRGVHWTPLIVSQLTNEVSYDGIRWIGRIKGKLAYQTSKNLKELILINGTEQ